MANIIGTLPVILQNGTLADASQVMADFNYIVNQVNANAQAASTPVPGTLIAVQIFTANGTYTPSANASKAWVKAIGGGGAGGSTAAAGAGATSIAIGGFAGAYGELYVTASLATQTVAIGAAGVPGAIGNNGGGTGGNTSFGTLMVCNGGLGGGGGAPATPPYVFQQHSAGAVVTGTGNIIIGGVGALPGPSLSLAPAQAVGGAGGSTLWGQGGQGADSATGTGGLAGGFGAGGGGACTVQSTAGFQGGAGSKGLLLVFEFV